MAIVNSFKDIIKNSFSKVKLETGIATEINSVKINCCKLNQLKIKLHNNKKKYFFSPNLDMKYTWCDPNVL